MTSPSQEKILIVDDEMTNIELLAEIFDEHYEVLFANNGNKALEIARNARPDIILLDVMMPGIDGFETCAQLKAQRSLKDIPVIFITGMGDGEAEVRGLELGAADYVTKPINPPVVSARVRNLLELKRARDQLKRLAITDGLTGIANRHHFEQVLQMEHDNHVRTGAELSLLLMDLDYFKPFNDTYGHLHGDDCLRQVARAIEEVIGSGENLAARYGGEEFVCVLPNTDAATAIAFGESIRQRIEALAIPHAQSQVAEVVTTSAGLVTGRCFAEKSVLHLLAMADEQLYRAKAAGRNRLSATSHP